MQEDATPSTMHVNVDGSLAEKAMLTWAAFVQAGGAASMVVTGGVRSGSVLSTANASRVFGSGTQLVDVRTAAPAASSSPQRTQATVLSAPGGSTTMAYVPAASRSGVARTASTLVGAAGSGTATVARASPGTRTPSATTVSLTRTVALPSIASPTTGWTALTMRSLESVKVWPSAWGALTVCGGCPAFRAQGRNRPTHALQGRGGARRRARRSRIGPPWSTP